VHIARDHLSERLHPQLKVGIRKRYTSGITIVAHPLRQLVHQTSRSHSRGMKRAASCFCLHKIGMLQESVNRFVMVWDEMGRMFFFDADVTNME
jgi:hypothetical protein